MNYEKFYIPKTLDDPEMIYFWTIGEVAIILSCIFIGFITRHPGMGILIGISIFYIYRKFKGVIGDIIILYIYWLFPKWLSGFKCLPESWRRRYVG